MASVGHHRAIEGASKALLWLGSLALCSGAQAHSFGQTYLLPVPVWLYLFGASAALVLSFLVVAFFITDRSRSALPAQDAARPVTIPGPVVGGLRAGSVAALLLATLAGLLGADNAYRNINMTLFWVIFALGFTYLTALIGNWYALVNPFRVVVEWIEGMLPSVFRGRVPYPVGLGYWPAMGLYMGFVWLELFGRISPRSLSELLISYLLLTVIGCWWVGKAAWFRYLDFYGIFLRLVARIAPIHIEENTEGAGWVLSRRQPLSGLLQREPVPMSLFVFVVFMLASTAFDGLHTTALWIGAFWENLYQWVLIPLLGDSSSVAFATVQTLFLYYQSLSLALSLLVYVALCWGFFFIANRVSKASMSSARLMRWFALSLLPIVLAYHCSHYFTLLWVQGMDLSRLISDPLGRGWNLFGTAGNKPAVVPDMGLVWHTQVFIIIAGHVFSVYIAHVQALMLFSNRKQAILSQLPVLVLMVGLTTLGLWILALPHGSGAG